MVRKKREQEERVEERQMPVLVKLKKRCADKKNLNNTDIIITQPQSSKIRRTTNSVIVRSQNISQEESVFTEIII
jgi:hypothetical protein